jgi:hypothetical protein
MEAQRSKNFKEFFKNLWINQCNLVTAGKECYDGNKGYAIQVYINDLPKQPFTQMIQ